MNILNTLRNNWKKTVVFSMFLGYGVNTLKSNIEIKKYMSEFSVNIMNTRNIFESSPSPPQNILVVMNPIANNKNSEKMFKKFCEPILHLAGYSVEILRTNHIGHAKAYIEEIKDLPDIIVVAGGDGTKSEVVTGLLRRRGNLCPVAFLPLGRSRQSGYFNLGTNQELEYIKTLSNALMPVLKGQCKYENVIQYDVLNNDDSDESTNKLKPIFGMNGFSWGLLKDIDSSKEKYWYLGPLKHHISAFLRSFYSQLDWNLETDFIYTPPCSGCSNCCVEKDKLPTKGFLLSKLVSPIKGDPLKNQIKNDKCATKVHGTITSNQINISLNQNEYNFAELESRFIHSLEPGWSFIKNIPNITKKSIQPNLVVKSRTIQLYPTDNIPNIFYSIDGEEYEPRAIKISVIPNAIKVFS